MGERTAGRLFYTTRARQTAIPSLNNIQFIGTAKTDRLCSLPRKIVAPRRLVLVTARVSRADDRVLAIAKFGLFCDTGRATLNEVCRRRVEM